MIYYLRKQFKKKYNLKGSLWKNDDSFDISIVEFNNFLKVAILEERPCLVSRFGSEELKWYLNFFNSSQKTWQRIKSFIKCEIDQWEDIEKLKIIENVTFKPATAQMGELFYKETQNTIPKIDVLGRWLFLERSESLKFDKHLKRIYLGFLEPYYCDTPWTTALKGKRVLVIHPMRKSIVNQYKRREKLFNNQELLPDFQLEVLQAPYFDDPRFSTWKDIYEFLKIEVNKVDFDVAILGCGSWGMPLGGFIKDKGKVAVHLGGATQLLFGIIGSRWETQWPEFRALNLVNEYWVRPLPEETPDWSNGYDKKSYW